MVRFSFPALLPRLALPFMSDPTDNPVLAVNAVSMHYGSRPALSDITFKVKRGEVIGLLGPNGSGKSTLLKIISGMIAPSHGEVRFGNSIIGRPTPGITYVPQRAGADWTFPITVLDAVLLGLSRRVSRFRRFSVDERQRAIATLAQVRMDRFASVQIGALSGGQQQRVFLARALLACGDVLLLDEPFTGVDIPTQELFVSLFDELTSRGIAIIYATHDLEQARQRADRLILLNRHLIADGPPSEVFTAAHIRQTFGGTVLVFDDSLTTGQGSPR
jgi:ABC-type Mn2+/Zn2+ transport system ATPase subunit